MAYKRELIVNNGSLTSYKKLLKVSDVCQYIDASKYPATKTINGVTFTNNGDGTITVNGTATADVKYGYAFLPNSQDGGGGGLDIISKFLYIGCPAGGSNSTYGIYNGWHTDNYQDIGSGVFTDTTHDKFGGFYRFSYNIGIRKGYTANNLVFKPMCIDLTEMYGAGNEPATVAEFKAKFPNEMYDYSPRCWVTSYKTGLIAKTKNLFDYTKVNGLEHTPTGNPYSDYLKINGESFGVMAGMYDRGVNFIPHFILDAGTYTISLIAKGTSPGDRGEFGIIKFNSDGTKPSFTKGWATSDSRQSYTFTLDENSEIAIKAQGYGNASNNKNLDSTFSNIQLEKGTVATDYVPYGYL